MLKRQWSKRENDLYENWLPSVVLFTSPSVCITENDLSLYGLNNFPKFQSISGEIEFDCRPYDALIVIVVRENEIALLTELIKKAEAIDPLLIFIFIIGSSQIERGNITPYTYAVFYIYDDHDVAPTVCHAIIALVDLLDVSRGLMGIDLVDIKEMIDGQAESRGKQEPIEIKITEGMITETIMWQWPTLDSGDLKRIGSIGYSVGSSSLSVVEEAWHFIQNKECKRFLLSFAGSPTLGLLDIKEAVDWLDNQAASDSFIYFGAVIDDSIPRDQISVVIMSFQ